MEEFSDVKREEQQGERKVMPLGVDGIENTEKIKGTCWLHIYYF